MEMILVKTHQSGDPDVIQNKLFEWLFSRVLASHHGGPGSIPGRDMSV